MSTPNPEYDPDWQVKWRAAQFRVDSVGHADNVSDMWTELEKRFPTLEAYHAAILDRIHSAFPTAGPAEDLLPFDPTLSPDAFRTKWLAIQGRLKRREWEAQVRNRKRHGQPTNLAVFGEPAAGECDRAIERIRWGGLHGRASGICETIVVRELYADEAHVCFLSAPSVSRGTYPSVDDTQGRVQLPTVYYRSELAHRYAPDRATWYYYETGPGAFEDAWFFRRARLEWEPQRTERFLWRQRNIPGDWFMRRESSTQDYHFRSVPRVIGEAVLLGNDDGLPIVELPDFHVA